MEKGLAIIEVNEAETKTVFIDQDALECERLNLLTKKRIAKAEKARREAVSKHRKAETAKARRRAYTLATIWYVLIRCAILGAVTWAGTAGMIHPFICVPVTLFCLCTACLCLGTWFGKSSK